MTPEYPEQQQHQLTAEEQAQLKAASDDLARDLQDAGNASKNKANTISPDLLNVLQETERTQFVRGLLEVQMSQDLFAQDARLARVFALSGAFSDIKGVAPQQAIAMAMTKIRLGRSWGLNEADSMQFIYFNNGRPSVMAELLASKLYESGLEWDIRWHQDAQKKCTGCTLYPKQRKGGGYEYLEEVDPEDPDGVAIRRVQVSFTKADADAALIWEKSKQIRLSDKWNFVSWAPDMYFSKCVVRLKRRYRPNILSGATTQYEADELPPVDNLSAAQREISNTAPPDADPRWHQAGSVKAAVEYAEKRLTEMEAEKAARQANGDTMRQALINRAGEQGAQSYVERQGGDFIAEHLQKSPAGEAAAADSATSGAAGRGKPQFGRKGQ